MRGGVKSGMLVSFFLKTSNGFSSVGHQIFGQGLFPLKTGRSGKRALTEHRALGLLKIWAPQCEAVRFFDVVLISVGASIERELRPRAITAASLSQRQAELVQSSVAHVVAIDAVNQRTEQRRHNRSEVAEVCTIPRTSGSC